MSNEKEKELSVKDRLKKKASIVEYTNAAMAAIYVGVIILAEVHNANLMFRTINWSGEFWPLQALASSVGMVSLGLAALFGLKMIEKSTPGLHRNVAYTFYGVDLILILFNWLVDAAINSGNISQLPNWLVVWNNVIVPITPIWVMLGVAAYKLTDPETRKKDDMMRYAQAVRDSAFAEAVAESDSVENKRLIKEKGNRISGLITRNALDEIDEVIDAVWRVVPEKQSAPKLTSGSPIREPGFGREELRMSSSPSMQRPLEPSGFGGMPRVEKEERREVKDDKPEIKPTATRVEFSGNSGNVKDEMKATLIKAKALIKPEDFVEMMKWIDGKSKNMEIYGELHGLINKALGAGQLTADKAKAFRDELKKIKADSLGE